MTRPNLTPRFQMNKGGSNTGVGRVVVVSNRLP